MQCAYRSPTPNGNLSYPNLNTAVDTLSPIAVVTGHGHRLANPDAAGVMLCPESGFRYQEAEGVLRCLDLDEEAPLPPELAEGARTYDEFKEDS